MKITYRTLRKLLERMSDEQLDCDLTVEDGFAQECFHAELRIAGVNHNSLDDNHPVIFFGDTDTRLEDCVPLICERIGL